MRLIILTLLGLCTSQGKSQALLGNLVQDVTGGVNNVVNGVRTGDDRDVCQRDVYQEYRETQTSIHTTLYKQVAANTDNHFVFSPYTIWLTLSALAEGADPRIQANLLQFLNLPKDACVRKKFYGIALNVEQPSRDVSLLRKHELVLDESLRVNPSWQNLMRTTKLLGISFAPMKTNAAATSQQLARFISARSNIALKGNSILLDSLDYQGLWTTAFPAMGIRREPFYNDQGQQVGAVNMMRMKKFVRIAHLPFMNAKVIELPVGTDGRYKMLITVSLGDNIIKNAIEIFMGSILQIFALLKMSSIPIEVAVPQFVMTSEFDARPVLEEIGLDAFFKNPDATSYVSYPPALPGGFMQRVSIRVGPDGTRPPPEPNSNDVVSGLFNIASNTATDFAAAVGHEFIANRPFMFGLFHMPSNTCLFAGAYARPS